MDAPYDVLSYVAVGVLAAVITYLFSVRTTRKGELYDAKMKAYGEVVGLYQEVFVGLDNLANLQEVDASDKDALLPNLINLASELSGLGDTDTLSSFTDTGKTSKSIKRLGEKQFVESLRSRASILNSRNIADSMKEVRFRAGQLALVRPSDSVKEGLNRVNASIAMGGQIIFLRAVDMNRKVFEDIEIPQRMKDSAVTPDKWREQVTGAIGGLVNAMISDLDATL